ncbi:MAG: PAS domain S-box protein [Sphingobacteriales bacterium]|nr:PAS domain S-box protein [Sphingobacteriales bacterium]
MLLKSNNISNNSENYLELINNLPGMIYRCQNDPFWTMKFISNRSVELTGFTPEELIDNKRIAFSDLIFEEDRIKVWEDVQEALKKREKYTLKYRILTKNHEIKWVGEQGYGVWNEKDELIFLEGIIMDISLQEQYKNSLEKAEERYRNIFENLLDVYYESTFEGKILEISPSVYHLLGYTREELIGNNVSMQYKDIAQRNEMINLLSETQSVHNYHITLLSKSGKEVEVGIHVTIDTKSREFPVMRGILRDITELMQMQASLEEREKYYRSLFTNAPSPFFSLNNNFYFEEANPAFLEMTGYHYEELLQKSIFDLIPENEHVRLDFIRQELEKNRKIDNFELNLVHKDGEIINILLSGNLCIDTHADTCISQFIATNFSQRKLLEEELEKAKRKAEESDRIKSAFLANMSHEIRTPMNAIMGFSSLLRDETLTYEERCTYIDIILKRGNDLLQIISDIIDISRIEAGDIRIVIDKIFVNKFLREITGEYVKIKKLKGKDHISIRNSLQSLDDNVYIESDKVRLSQIFENLLSNALKFTQDGYIEIGYEILPGFIEFYVRDTGIGIPPDKHEIIFERFRQATDSQAIDYGGTGLGLAIVKSLVTILGGSLRLDSAVNSGSTFYFTIPFSGKLKADHSAKKVEMIEHQKPNLTNRKILIAEDEINNYYYLESVISRYGAKVIWATDGYSAIEMMKNQPDIDLVLMDIKMPGIDGFIATRKIREFNQGVVIIAQTAYAMSHDRERAFQSGCTDYISKPIRIESLNKMLLKYFPA